MNNKKLLKTKPLPGRVGDIHSMLVKKLYLYIN